MKDFISENFDIDDAYYLRSQVIDFVYREMRASFFSRKDAVRAIDKVFRQAGYAKKSLSYCPKKIREQHTEKGHRTKIYYKPWSIQRSDSIPEHRIYNYHTWTRKFKTMLMCEILEIMDDQELGSFKHKGVRVEILSNYYHFHFGSKLIIYHAEKLYKLFDDMERFMIAEWNQH